MKKVKADRKQTRRAMYLTEVVVRLVSPYMTSVMNSLFELPTHVPMRELSAMEREARFVDAARLLDITESASPVSVGVPCSSFTKRGGHVCDIQRKRKKVGDEISPAASVPPRPSCYGSRSR